MEYDKLGERFGVINVKGSNLFCILVYTVGCNDLSLVICSVFLY